MDTTTFVRDEFSKALINTNSAEIQARLARKQQTKQIAEIQQDIDNVKLDISEIKQLLQLLISHRG